MKKTTEKCQINMSCSSAYVRSNGSGTSKSLQASWHSCPGMAHTSAVESMACFGNTAGSIAVCKALLQALAITCSQVVNTDEDFITIGRASACLEMRASGRAV